MSLRPLPRLHFDLTVVRFMAETRSGCWRIVNWRRRWIGSGHRNRGRRFRDRRWSAGIGCRRRRTGRCRRDWNLGSKHTPGTPRILLFDLITADAQSSVRRLWDFVRNCAAIALTSDRAKRETAKSQYGRYVKCRSSPTTTRCRNGQSGEQHRHKH